MLNMQKIAFITCVNDEEKYEECRYYLERLRVPDGYTTDLISIRKAPSMTSGYNAGMMDSDAKYKVYLHQDVFIININFIADMLETFASDEKIGMLGMIGKKEMGTAPLDMMRWDAGRVIYDYGIISRYFPEKGCYAEVALVDGLLLATQYDIPWREDIFDGWDFYDASQCMEFKRAGYKVVVPYQEEIWCCHDALSSILTAYFDYYESFLHEYAGVMGISAERDSQDLLSYETDKEYARKMEQMKESIEMLMDVGGRRELRTFFENSGFRENPHLREYRAIVHIDQMEEQNQSDMRFWDDSMSASQLILKLRTLKCALKRIEYGADEIEKIRIEDNYSKYAVLEICNQYSAYKDKICRKLGNYLLS